MGSGSDEFHAALADHLIDAGVDYAILVGEEMAALADALKTRANAAKSLERRVDFTHGDDVDQALARLRADMAPGDAILVKGSNSVGLSRLVAGVAGGGM